MVEIRGNLTFFPGTTAGQIEARATSIVHKVHVFTKRVGAGHSCRVEPKLKAKVQWIPRRGQPDRMYRLTIIDSAS